MSSFFQDIEACMHGHGANSRPLVLLEEFNNLLRSRIGKKGHSIVPKKSLSAKMVCNLTHNVARPNFLRTTFTRIVAVKYAYTFLTMAIF